MNRGRKNWIRSFGYAASGIAHAFRQERHMQFHVAAATAVTLLALWLRVDRADWLWLGAAIALVITAELFNTAVERAVELAAEGQHPLAKIAKDTAAGAVLVAAIFAAVVGFVVLGPPLWRMLTGT